MTSLQRTRLLAARKKLLLWHKKNGRRFSWRKKVRVPYAVLLSELMGQQTQATRIEEYLGKFLSAFPTVRSLANAKQSEVVKLWQGLGYNRRAINLHRTAKIITAEHKGKIPDSFDTLVALPGIGPYTANAILVFAFEKPVSAVDINVTRVITRIAKKCKQYEDLLPLDTVYEICNEILPIRSNRAWHEALMDLGATICTKRNPNCPDCPLVSICASNTLYLQSKVNVGINRGVEKQYFGQPKRIWRGRILKFITKNHPTALTQLQLFLSKEFEHADPSTITNLILPELQAEGFIARKNDQLTLA